MTGLLTTASLLLSILLFGSATGTAELSCYDCQDCPIPFDANDARVKVFSNCFDRACYSYHFSGVMRKGCLGTKDCTSYRSTLQSHHSSSEFYLNCCAEDLCNTDDAPTQTALETHQIGFIVGGVILAVVAFVLLCVFIYPRIQARVHSSCCLCCLQRNEKI